MTVFYEKGRVSGKKLLARRRTSSVGIRDFGHKVTGLVYEPKSGLEAFVDKVRTAAPLDIVEVERRGIGGRLLKDIAIKMEMPQKRFFHVIGVAKATAEKKAVSNELLSGAEGQAALGVVRLLGIVKGIVENSTAAEAKGFDAAKWLGHWIEQPQPALGGKKPADLLDTPTGIEMVARVLGAIESAAYQ